MSASPDKIFVHTDVNIGVSGSTPLRIKQHANGTFEARMGGSMMGSTNMTEAEMAATGHDPFHPDWHDNYFKGTGSTEAEAVDGLKKDMASMSDLLWAE